MVPVPLTIGADNAEITERIPSAAKIRCSAIKQSRDLALGAEEPSTRWLSLVVPHAGMVGARRFTPRGRLGAAPNPAATFTTHVLRTLLTWRFGCDLKDDLAKKGNVLCFYVCVFP